MDSDEGRAFLEKIGLLEGGEWDVMVPGDRHTTTFWWLQFKLTQLAEEGVITEQRLTSLTASITNMRAQANDLMSSLDRDAPFPYVTLCGTLVTTNVFIMST